MIKRHCVLGADGRLIQGATPKMGDDLLLEALRWMLLSRLYDERVGTLQRQGRYGVFSPALGQEASVIGSSFALDRGKDWIVPQYRELMAIVHHGYPLERLSANYMGRGSEATRIPDGVKLLPNQIALAAHLPHATGLAWGLKLQGLDSVVLTYVGDGGSSEGDFHEGLNLAGVQKAPVVFFLQNNQWAISTPRRVQSATPSFALRAAGYGFPGIEVDGNDVLAVYDVTVDAVERARAGDGPTLIEAITYRMGFHNSSDNPSRYEDPREHEEALKRDPIDRVLKYLRSREMMDDKREANIRAEITQQIDDTLDKAAAFPAATPDHIFDNIYADPPERVRRQRSELLAEEFE
jgi:pyruvate dehydrogenase E1 component alpha subunit